MMRTTILECIFVALQAFSISAYPQPSSGEILPRNVLDVIPECGKNCLWDFIVSSYPPNITCDLQNDLECLCRTNTTMGLTLGEGAVLCVYQFCPGGLNLIKQELSICSGQKGALPNTHSVLSAAPATAADDEGSKTTTMPTSISTPMSVNSPGTSVAPTSARPTTPGNLALVYPIAATSTPTAQQQMGSRNSTVAAGPQASLSRAQIIGISVGGAAVAGFGLVILLLARCVPRRDRTRRQTVPIMVEISRPILNEPNDWSDNRSFDSGATVIGDAVALQNVGALSRNGQKAIGFSADWRAEALGAKGMGVAASPAVSPEPEYLGRRARKASLVLPGQRGEPEVVRHRPAQHPSAQKQGTNEEARPVSTVTLFEDVD